MLVLGRSGGTGRRAGLKIRFPPGSVGSIPTFGIARRRLLDLRLAAQHDEDVEARAAETDVRAGAAVDRVRAAAAEDAVVVGAAAHHVDAGGSEQQVVA